MKRKALTCILLTALISAFALQTFAQEPYAVQEASVTVYRDGVAHVTVVVSVDPAEPSVVFPLLSPSPYNVLALDEANEPLSYSVTGSDITVYTLGASKLTLEYDSDTLASKSAGVWTVSLTTPYRLNLTLPEGATVLYFNAPPASIKSEGGRLVLALSPGTWEVSYTLEPLQQPPQQPAPQQPPQPSTQTPLYALALAPLAAAVAALILFRRKRRLEALKREEADVVRFLRERGGRALEAELREAFPNIPKTSMWRLVKRLEKKGILTVRKVGLQNVVELKSRL